MNSRPAIIAALAAVCCVLGLLTGCQAQADSDFSGAREVAQLATYECTYHSVARIERGADVPILNIGKKQEWFEYDATVEYGIDASKVAVGKPDESGNVTVSIPQAQVLGAPNIDADSISNPVDANGLLTNVSNVERRAALSQAQKETEEKARNDDAMLASARKRAKTLLEEYVVNVGKVLGEKYTVTWQDVD